jgi:GNAT superfamily N-acetyltransferase
VIAVPDTCSVQLVHSWDEEEIADLYRAGGWWKEEYRVEEIRHLIRGSFLFAVATDEKTGRAIGMGRVLSDSVSDGYIQDLVVIPEFRKGGTGSKIVSLLVKTCRDRGLTWIALIAEPGSDSFYVPLGFQEMRDYVPMIYKAVE